MSEWEITRRKWSAPAFDAGPDVMDAFVDEAIEFLRCNSPANRNERRDFVMLADYITMLRQDGLTSRRVVTLRRLEDEFPHIAKGRGEFGKEWVGPITHRHIPWSEFEAHVQWPVAGSAVLVEDIMLVTPEPHRPLLDYMQEHEIIPLCPLCGCVLLDDPDPLCAYHRLRGMSDESRLENIRLMRERSSR